MCIPSPQSWCFGWQRDTKNAPAILCQLFPKFLLWSFSTPCVWDPPILPLLPFFLNIMTGKKSWDKKDVMRIRIREGGILLPYRAVCNFSAFEIRLCADFLMFRNFNWRRYWGSEVVKWSVGFLRDIVVSCHQGKHQLSGANPLKDSGVQISAKLVIK